jgi:hypothetical protein
MNAETKVCQNCKNDFTIEPDDFGFYEKIKVPPPTFCPECRAIRRLMWRNERSLYHNTCAFSGKPLISMFSPETGLTIYEHSVWWSDQWNPLDYGQEYDFSKPFFQQFEELLSRVPLNNLGNTNIINCNYVNHTADCKNCYLTYASFVDENISYSNGAVESKDSYDLYKVFKSQQCYEDIVCAGMYKSHFSYDSDDCIDSSFLTSCLNVQNSLGCVNLRHKTNCIFNVQYSKENYEIEIAKYDFGSYKTIINFKEKYEDFLKNQPRRFANIIKSTSVTGDNVMNSKNSKMIFDSFGSVEDSKYVTHTKDLRNGYDGYGIGAKAEFLYEGVDFGVDAYRQFFGVLTYGGIETNYTYMCFNSNYIFGSIGLRKQEYCILNKKYSKEEYEKMLPKVIEHMNTMPYVDQKGCVYKYGEFFPSELSPFYYNETIANEYYPLEEAQVLSCGLKWKNEVPRTYEIDIRAEDLPDHINDVDESIIGKVIACEHNQSCNEQCTEAFKIRAEDLQFYKKMNLALPRLCPNCRHFQRLKKRNPLKLWHRTCMCDQTNHNHGEGKCQVEFETSYAPDRPEIVYCEKCYQQEVY